MPKAKPLSKELIMAAVNKTKSNRAAARYLNVSYIHIKSGLNYTKVKPTIIYLNNIKINQEKVYLNF